MSLKRFWTLLKWCRYTLRSFAKVSKEVKPPKTNTKGIFYTPSISANCSEDYAATQWIYHQPFQVLKIKVLTSPPSLQKVQDSCIFWHLKLLVKHVGIMAHCRFCRFCSHQTLTPFPSFSAPLPRNLAIRKIWFSITSKRNLYAIFLGGKHLKKTYSPQKNISQKLWGNYKQPAGEKLP